MRSSRMTQSLPEYQHHTDTDANMPMRPKPRETQGVLGDIFALANPLSPTVVSRRQEAQTCGSGIHASFLACH